MVTLIKKNNILFFISIFFLTSGCDLQKNQTKRERIENEKKFAEQEKLWDIKYLLKEVKKNENEAVIIALSKYYLSKSKEDSALIILKKFHHRHPLKKETLFEISSIYLETEMNIDSGFQYFVKFNKIDSTIWKSNYLHGVYYQRKGELNLADSFFKEVLKVNPKNVSSLLRRSKIYFEQDYIQKAKIFIDSSLKYHRTNYEANILSGMINEKIGFYKAAIENYSICMIVEPKKAGGYNKLLNLAIFLNNIEDICSVLRAARYHQIEIKDIESLEEKYCSE